MVDWVHEELPRMIKKIFLKNFFAGALTNKSMISYNLFDNN